MKWLFVFIPLFSFGQDFSRGPRFTFLEIDLGQQSIGTNSQIYDFNQENLLFNPSDLDGLDVGVGMYWQRSNILAMGIKLNQFDESVVTEDAYYIYEDGAPILQTIDLKKTYVAFDMVVTPWGAGETFGTVAWAPKNFVPYFRVGAGAVDWSYNENGDFVDYADETIFFDNYLVSGSAFGFHLGAGLRVKIAPKVDISMDYTYTNSEASMDGGDFSGFGDLDLSSKTASLGVSFKIF